MRLTTRFLLLASGALVASRAGAQPSQSYPVDICGLFQPQFVPRWGWDRWADPDQARPARGMEIMVWDFDADPPGWVADDWADLDGCLSVDLISGHVYAIYSKSRAMVNGVQINAYDTLVDKNASQPRMLVHTLGYVPTYGDTHYIFTPLGDPLYHLLAIGTYAFYLDTLGVEDEPTPYVDFLNDANADGGAHNNFDAINIKDPATADQVTVAHELGHMIAKRRDENRFFAGSTDNPGTNLFNAPMDGCFANNGCWQSKYCTWSKEYQGIAAREGWVIFTIAALWNRSDPGDEGIVFASGARDFDLDRGTGTPTEFFDDNWGYGVQVGVEEMNGLFDIADRPVVIEPNPADPLESYVTDRDWLEDLVLAQDPVGCTDNNQPLLFNRGTVYDWARFWWDLRSNEQIPIRTLADVLDTSDPGDWDWRDTAVPSDLPTSRTKTAAWAEICGWPGQGWQQSCIDMVNLALTNGLDH